MAEAPQISTFRQLIDFPVKEFVEASRQLGEPVNALACMVRRAFELQLSFIVGGIGTPRPDNATFNNMIEPLSGILREIQEFRDRNRHVEEFFNHLSTVTESLVALSWISVSPAPVPFIRDMRDAGDYFGNRVLNTYKGNQKHQTWINKWNEIMKALELYVKDYHLTGFAWGSASTAGSVGGPGAPARNPPPPPPPPTFDAMTGGDDRHALLNQINQGVGITRMLRPVNREQVSEVKHTAAAGSISRSPQAPKTYPPKYFLEGRKWRVEHQNDNYSLVIDNDEMSQSLSMFKCQNSGLVVRNKMNGVSIDNCKKSTIMLNDIISSVELIRCESIKLHCDGHVPLISLDNCESIQVFITDKSIDAEFISSKSSSLNICLLAPDGDYIELPVPEQIKTVINGRNIQSSVVEKI